MRSRRKPLFLPPGAPLTFPDPAASDDEGLLAIGGDLTPERLLFAYERGVFPWYDEGLPPMWWCPNPRAVMDAEHLHVSRSLRRVLRSGRFSVSFDRAFRDVMLECGRERESGTWILPEMVDAYCALHELGHAHSVEVWHDAVLVGGLYGVQRGALFAAESMFHRLRDASKVALACAVERLFAEGISVFDVQFLTPHLASLGAYEIPRSDYLERAARAVNTPVTFAGSAWASAFS
ncbi:MAG TPA: leucyl/phenylalanyl-tRNA--protein transferase [Polyangiaceae bacterium]|nr:leucyl/phenylalanyl-tRNA--protein transferase [Polyangiaceae bacterium]